jgi:hypothetical protein
LPAKCNVSFEHPPQWVTRWLLQQPQATKTEPTS